MKIKEYVLPSLLFLLFVIILCGVIYPCVITGIAWIGWREKAEGEEKYIGQRFTKEEYFWGRPSESDYAFSKAGERQIISEEYKQLVEKRRQEWKATAHNEKEVPQELLQASGSGLDPNISEESALYQVDRIAKARQMEKGEIEEMIKEEVEKNTKLYPWLGEKMVNVKKLNQALEERK